MSNAILEVFADPNWATIFTEATGIKTTLVSSTKYEVTDAEGADLVVTGTNIKVQNFFGYQVPVSGTLTGFNLTVGKTELALGVHYAMNATALYNALQSYIFGDKTALADLWFSVPTTIEGTAAHVEANLAPLESYSTHITAIDITTGKVDASTAAFHKYQNILDKVVGGFEITDTAPNIAAAINVLQADSAHISAIDITGAATPILKLSAAAAKADAPILAKIDDNYVLGVHQTNGSWNLTGHGNGLTINDIAGVDVITSNGASEEFVFKAGFGQATITAASTHWSGAAHDVVELAKSEFINFATVLKDASIAQGHVEISSASGDHLLLDGFSSLAQLHAASADFKFV
jgi:hypothetical protein